MGMLVLVLDVVEGDWEGAWPKFWDDFSEWVLRILRTANDESESFNFTSLMLLFTLVAYHPYPLSLIAM